MTYEVYVGSLKHATICIRRKLGDQLEILYRSLLLEGGRTGKFIVLFYFERQCKMMKNRNKTALLIALSTSSHDEEETDCTFCCRIIPDSRTTL